MNNQMEIFPEIKKLAGLNDKRLALIKKLETKLDVDGLDFFSAQFISGCKEKDGHLYQNGCRLDNGMGDDCYCFQTQGYCEDNFYGTVYYKTDVPGTFVAINFEM